MVIPQQAKIALLLLYSFLSSIMVLAQEDEVTFEVNVSKEKLGINERLRVDFTMNRDGDDFVAPGFTGFEVLMGCLLYTSPSPRDLSTSRMPSSA